MANDIVSSVTSSVKSQIGSVTNKVAGAFNFATIMSKLRTSISKLISNVTTLLTKKPAKKKDYLKIGKIYLSKRTLFYTTLFLFIGGYLIINFAYPWAEGRLWYASMQINSNKYNEFTGKAKVHDNMKILIYEGEMLDGKITGKGKQYDAKGNLVYKGEFENNQYSGKGEKIKDGIIRYSGSFVQGLFEGDGKLFNQDGKLIYSGNFSIGQKSGNGIEFNPDTGKKIYNGEFVSDLREGEGTVYDNDGTTVIYEGSFAAGLYSGEGKLYENKKLRYKGQFAEGLYEGKGTLYDTKTGQVLYEGDFEAGLRQGDGSSFDKLGAVTFNGNYNDDTVNYFNYLGKNEDDVVKEFGKPSYRTEKDARLILTYVSLDISLVFEGDEKGVYSCSRILKGMKDTIFGLSAKSSQEEIKQKMGTPFSSIDYNFPNYYKTLFSNLSIGISVKDTTPSDKFIMDNYFVRFYYDSTKSEIKCVEISSI